MAVVPIVYLYKVESKEYLIFFFSRTLHQLTCVGVILLLGNINPLFQLFIPSQGVLLEGCSGTALKQRGLLL